ncbi:MAG TPA: zinc dependent phospholipase C family protein [Candidatus Acidoferrales bacterium]|nr:zinc dependent phospholipase C family protein [Candidatus Acidoferrales bacterium]
MNSWRFSNEKPHSAPTVQMFKLFAGIVLIFLCSGSIRAYSVLSHEAIIDSSWKDSIRPLLIARFPNATKDELREAHAYAYGGAIIQDMGYYPHGSHLFSDLTHYVRSAEFIRAMLRDAQTLDEYAFALGSLAHYAADDNGHRLAVNRVVPMLYPDLRKKFGDEITYEQNPLAHLKTEFGFDVLEVAKERFAPDAYRDFIGFQVATPLLERAFEETYCVPLRSIFDNLDQSIGSYRFSVRSVMPEATKVAWAMRKDDIQKDLPTMTRKKFLFNLSRASFEKNWGKDYQKPGWGDNLIAFFLRIIPKVGPLKALTFHAPTPQAEDLFMQSFNATLDNYRQLLANVQENRLEIKNMNFDTGSATAAGEYFMADNAYAALVDRLARNQFKNVSPELRADIAAYYSNPNSPIATKKKPKDWARIRSELQEMRGSLSN